MEFTDSSNKEPTQPNNSEFQGFGLSKEIGAQQNSLFRPKSSKFRGVQKIKDKETYVAHVYDNGHLPNEARTIYLGRFDTEEKAARAHDLVSLKFWGASAVTNFPVSEYEKEIETITNMSDQDVMVAVRRSSNSFSRGKSKYRGVVGHIPSGKWQARTGPGKDSFLGTYDTEEEAAMAFDVVSIKRKGIKAMTNFDIRSYNLRVILEGNLEEEGDLTIDNADASSSQRSTSTHRRSKKRLSNLQQYLTNYKKPETGDLSIITNSPNNSTSTLIAPLASGLEAGSATIPFLLESLSISREPKYSSSFNHSSSSPFQYYQPRDRPSSDDQEQGTNFFVPSCEYWRPDLNPSYETSLFQQDAQQFKDPGVGFQHATSSLFQPFSRP